jgi:RNA-binding protein YhbY
MSAQLKKKLKHLINRVLNEKAKVRIGKNGITPTLISEIDNQLSIHGLIKIRFLNNFLTEDLDKDIKSLNNKTNSQLVDKRGKVILIYRPLTE